VWTRIQVDPISGSGWDLDSLDLTTVIAYLLIAPSSVVHKLL